MQLDGQAAAQRKHATHFSKAIFVALQLVLATKSLLEYGATHGALAVRVVFDFGGLKHLLEGDAHAFGNGGCVFDDRHEASITRGCRQDFRAVW